MTLRDSVSVPKGVVFQKIDDEVVLLNLKSGIYYGLDAVGTRIWELLDRQGSLAAVVESMLQEYEVASEDMERDLLQMVTELHAHGLIETHQR